MFHGRLLGITCHIHTTFVPTIFRRRFSLLATTSPPCPRVSSCPITSVPTRLLQCAAGRYLGALVSAVQVRLVRRRARLDVLHGVSGRRRYARTHTAVTERRKLNHDQSRGLNHLLFVAQPRASHLQQIIRYDRRTKRSEQNQVGSRKSDTKTRVCKTILKPSETSCLSAYLFHAHSSPLRRPSALCSVPGRRLRSAGRRVKNHGAGPGLCFCVVGMAAGKIAEY